MVRKLKHHEQKLLKKVDFLEKNMRVVEVMRKYHLSNREDYTKYNKLCGLIKSIGAKLSKLDSRDPFRVEQTEHLLDKLYKMGLINTKKSLHLSEKVPVSAFCRRRLPVVMVRLKMAESIKQAVRYIEQGHVRVGPQPVTDPAYIVTRSMEDFVTWVDSSKIRRHIAKYNDKLDDFDLL